MVISITHSLEFENPLRGTVEYVDMYILTRSYRWIGPLNGKKERKFSMPHAIAAYQVVLPLTLPPPKKSTRLKILISTNLY